VRIEIGPGKLEHTLKRLQRIAGSSKVERDKVGLAVRQNRHGRRIVAKMAAAVELGQRGLHRPVAAVDHQHLRLHARDRPQRLADLIDMLHLIVEDVVVPGAKAPHLRKQRPVSGRAWVREERDPGHSGQLRLTGPMDSPWR
jgi:hypothetical protein